MTKLGKIFTTILMLLSIGFFVIAVMANLTYVNYAPILNNPDTGLKAVAQRLQSRVSDLTEQIEKQKAAIELEIASRQAALAALQVELEQLTFDVRSSEQNLETKQRELNQLAIASKTAQDDLSAAGKQTDDTREQLNQTKAQRDELFGKYQLAYSDLLKLQGDHRTLKSQYEQLTGNAPTAPNSDLSPSDIR